MGIFFSSLRHQTLTERGGGGTAERSLPMRAAASYVLYVARDRRRPSRHDVGSVLCMDLLRHLPPDVVHLVEATAQTRPSWLEGTPTLRDDETGEVWTGHQAVRRLQVASIHYARQEAEAEARASRAASSSSRQQRDAPPRRFPPPGAGTPGGGKDRPPSPPPPEEEEGSGVDSLWQSQLPDGDLDEDDPAVGADGERKLTADDLNRALAAQQRQA